MSHAPQPRPSWKQSRQQTTGHSSFRWARWFFGGLSLTLLGLFGWIVYALLVYREPQIQLVAMVAGNYRQLAVPAVPFAQNDLATIRQAIDAGEARHIHWHDWSSLLESRRFGQFASQLKELKFGKRDTLVVYLSAHGLSFPEATGSADLLGRDFDIRQPEQARWPLEELLRDLAQCPASHKILVLDTAHLTSDPRLGLLANGFSAAAARWIEMRLPANSNLWVLTTSSPLETTQWLPQQPGTLFGHLFARAILGQADVTLAGEPDDDRLTLDEVYRYVYHGCRQASATHQTPCLVPPSASASPDWTLAFVHHSEATVPDPASEPSDPAASTTNSAANGPSSSSPPAPLAKTGSTGDSANPGSANPDEESRSTAASESPAASSTSAPASPATPPPPSTASDTPLANDSSAKTVGATESDGTSVANSSSNSSKASGPSALRAILDQAWQLRDTLQSQPIAPQQWAPQEFAPQYWRELNAHLLAFELQDRAGPAEIDVAQLLLQSLENLVRLSKGESVAPPEHRELFVDHVLLAAHQFRSHERYQKMADLPPGPLAQVVVAMREVERDAYPLLDYLQWFAAASRDPASERSLDQAFHQQLRSLMEQIAAFRREIQQLAHQPLPAGAEEQVLDLQANVRAASDAVRREIRQRFQDALDRPRDATSQRELLLLLQSPLLSFSQRQQATTQLATLPPLPTPTDLRPVELMAPQVLRDVSSQGRQKWHSIWQLYQTLIATNDPQYEVSSDIQGFHNGVEFWSANQRAGAVLHNYFAQLPQRCRGGEITDASDPSDDTEAISERAPVTSQLAQLVDVRDVMTSELYHAGFPRLDLQPPRVQPMLTATWQPQGSIPLYEDRETDVVLQVVRTDSVEPRMRWELRFPEEAMEVTYRGKRLNSGAAPPLEFTDVRLDIPLKVRAKMQINVSGQPVDRLLFVRLRAGSVTADSRLTCQLPRPNEVRLIARNVGSDAVNELGSDAIEVHTFANRTTSVPLALQNLSGVARSVQVQLFALPPIPDAQWPPGRIVQADGRVADRILSSVWDHARQQLRPGLQPISWSPAPLALPADGKPVDLILVDTQPATPASSRPENSAETAGASTPAAKLPPDISQGLLCLITEVVSEPTSSSPRGAPLQWRRWIQLNSRPPRDFYEAEATYDLNQARIKLTPKSGSDQPTITPESPLAVVWRGAQQETLATRTLERFGPVNLQISQAKSVNQAEWSLDVDNFPRAFRFRMPLEYQSHADPLPANDVDPIVIEHVSDDGRLYLRAGVSDKLPLAPEDKRERIVLSGADVTAAIPVSGQPKDLLIGLRCDAPATSFGSDDAYDRIELTLRDTSDEPVTPPVTLYADRQVRFQWNPIGPNGELVINTLVSDFTQNLRLTGAEGEFQLTATMFLGGEPHEDDSLRIICDAQPPDSIRARLVDRTPFIGDPIRISLDVRDLSGLARVDYGLVKRPQDPLDEATKLTQTARDNQLTLEIPPPEVEGKVSRWIAMVLYDRAGNSVKTAEDTDFRPLPVTISPKPQATSDGPAAPFVGSISGRVKAGPRFFPDGIEVKLLKGTEPLDKTTTANDGQFQFNRIEAGTDYSLEASGRTPVGRFVGKKSFKFEKPEDYRQPILFELEKEKPKDAP